MTWKTAVCVLVLAAAAAAGGLRPGLVTLVDHADAVVVGRASRDAVDAEWPGQLVTDDVRVVVDEVLFGDVAPGAVLGRGSADVGPRVLAFVIDGELSSSMRRVDDPERRRALVAAVAELRTLRAREGSRTDLKTLLLRWVADPHLRDEALVELACRRAGHTSWLGETSPRWRLTEREKAALVDVIETLDGTDGLDGIVALIGDGFGGPRYTRALFERLDAHPDAQRVGESKRRLARLVGSARAAEFAETRSTREFLDVVRPLVPREVPR